MTPTPPMPVPQIPASWPEDAARVALSCFDSDFENLYGQWSALIRCGYDPSELIYWVTPDDDHNPPKRYRIELIPRSLNAKLPPASRTRNRRRCQ